MNAGIWESLYQSMQKPQLDPVITGFNANIDRIIPVTPGLLRTFEAMEGFDVILHRLKQSMRYCSADEVFISEPSLFQKLSELFIQSGSLSIGGQAGIAAVHLRSLGIQSVTCAVPGAGPGICTLLQKEGVNSLTFDPVAGKRPDTTHLIFEYSPGLVPLADRVIPRNNRFIVSPIHDASTIIIPEGSVNSFRDQIISCRRAFLSGYQYLKKEPEFVTAARQIRLIRDIHPLMRTHVECVSGADQKVMAMILRHILPAADSIGLNERELGLFMQALRTPGLTKEAYLPPSPVTCVRDAVALADATGVSRVHLHTFGYYILILKLKTSEPEVSRNALLLAARVAADSAGTGGQILSREGLLAYDAVKNVFGTDETPGIFRYDEWVVVVVPACISPMVHKTTGLGDILSATAFVADRF